MAELCHQPHSDNNPSGGDSNTASVHVISWPLHQFFPVHRMRHVLTVTELLSLSTAPQRPLFAGRCSPHTVYAPVSLSLFIPSLSLSACSTRCYVSHIVLYIMMFICTRRGTCEHHTSIIHVPQGVGAYAYKSELFKISPNLNHFPLRINCPSGKNTNNCDVTLYFWLS